MSEKEDQYRVEFTVAKVTGAGMIEHQTDSKGNPVVYSTRKKAEAALNDLKDNKNHTVVETKHKVSSEAQTDETS